MVFNLINIFKKLAISSLNEKFFFFLVVFASDAFPNRSGAEVERWNRDFTPADGFDTTHTTRELKKLPDEHGDFINFHAC